MIFVRTMHTRVYLQRTGQVSVFAAFGLLFIYAIDFRRIKPYNMSVQRGQRGNTSTK